MGKQKPYEHPLSPDLASAILNIPIEERADESPPRTVGERIIRARSAIDDANEHLALSPMAKIVARSLMHDLKKRGGASIVVRLDGTVVLRVVYGEDEDEVPQMRRDVPAVQAVHRSELPYLDDLRAQAQSLGVDISHLGRQRRNIHEFLVAHRENLVR